MSDPPPGQARETDRPLMEIAIIESCSDDRSRQLARQAADLHYDSLSYSSFITKFGRGFLAALYQSLLDYRLGFLLYAEREGRLAGFIMACPDSSQVMSVLRRRPCTFARFILPRLLMQPALIRNAWQSLSYAKAEGVTIPAELLVIAVNEKLRSQGLGAALVARLDQEFAQRGIKEYKVTVHQNKERTNQFYLRNQMTLARTFTFYGLPWNIYVRRIAPAGEN